MTNELNKCPIQNIGLTHVKTLLFASFPFWKTRYSIVGNRENAHASHWPARTK